MPVTLPATPIGALDISSTSLKLKMHLVVTAAKLFGFWKRPDPKTATTFEEMGLRDIFYWVYKCTHPVTRPEAGVDMAGLLMRDAGIVRLPEGFEKTATATLGAGGDLLQAKGLDRSRDVLFEKVADLLFDRTVSYANFESPITTQELKEEVISDREAPYECCSREQFDILKGHKGKTFTVMHTANNHMFDYKVEGLETTHEVFAEEGILAVGTNATPEEYGRGRILEAGGLKLGFATATFGLNGHMMPDEEKFRIHHAKLSSKLADPDLDLVRRQIEDCKARGCDFIFASLHWGWEFELFPRRQQVEAARALVEMGADAILSHHPHVIQPVEYYRSKRDPDRVAVITYSLGSLTWGYTAPYLVLSAILNLSLAKGRFKGREVTYVESAKVTPVFRSAVAEDGGIVTRIEKLADHVDGRSKTHPPAYIAEIKRLSDLVLGPEALS
jgi:poly-gamma-glutamate synthesis protein (capsule biosynthesis protein)